MFDARSASSMPPTTQNSTRRSARCVGMRGGRPSFWLSMKAKDLQVAWWDVVGDSQKSRTRRIQVPHVNEDNEATTPPRTRGYNMIQPANMFGDWGNSTQQEQE